MLQIDRYSGGSFGGFDGKTSSYVDSGTNSTRARTNEPFHSAHPIPIALRVINQFISDCCVRTWWNLGVSPDIFEFHFIIYGQPTGVWQGELEQQAATTKQHSESDLPCSCTVAFLYSYISSTLLLLRTTMSSVSSTEEVAALTITNKQNEIASELEIFMENQEDVAAVIATTLKTGKGPLIDLMNQLFGRNNNIFITEFDVSQKAKILDDMPYPVHKNSNKPIMTFVVFLNVSRKMMIIRAFYH